MKPNQELERIEKLYREKIARRIEEIGRWIWSPCVPLDSVEMAETDDHLTLDEARRLRYKSVRPGRRWGRPWSTAWFRLRGTLPKSFAGKSVSLLFETQAECIIFRDGKPVQGLDRNRRDYVLFDRAGGGEKIELFVEAGASDAFGVFEQRVYQPPQLAVYNADLWTLWCDLKTLADMVGATNETPLLGHANVERLHEDDTRRAQLLFTLNKAVDRFDYQSDDPDTIIRFARKIRRELKPLLARPAHASAQTIACFGHAHIDVAWLWPLAETYRKCGRTFSNILELMDRYPDFVFCQSQPQLYEYTRDRYPDLYKRIHQKVRKGQWVPTGSAWVEMDCNISGPESLVRQMLFGIRFFQQEFNHTPVCLWLPDVFGYAASLPQILQQCNIPYFLTQKISWNQFTKFPYHSFHWEGIDGSRVLSHFQPGDNYNMTLAPNELLYSARNYLQKDRSPIHASLFGYGDGGGGPTKLALEYRRRAEDLEGLPKCEPMTPAEFFHRLETESSELPLWVGELYLELHRGTLTTQGQTKWFNRKCEMLLRETEALCALNSLAGTAYPRESLNDAWKLVLLNQFHDIIPGSSITKVYEDSQRQYRQVLDDVGDIHRKAVNAYARRVDTRGDGQAVLAFNSLNWSRNETIELAEHDLTKNKSYLACTGEAQAAAVQVGVDGVARFRAALPSLGHTVVHLREGENDHADLPASPRKMENDLLRVQLDAKGRITRITDKRNGREVLEKGRTANQFILFEDKPVNWDAWDVDVFYNDKPLETDGELLSSEIVETGPVRTVLRQKRRISKSTVTQDIILTADSPRLDFRTTVDWGDEKNVLLKVAFPVNVRSEHARFEIQFGHLERTTHWNRPQDLAQFEVAAQKWADLSEGDAGVALLNDSKYGCDVQHNVLRLSLLRAPKHPDPSADINRTHQFTYALLPHVGPFSPDVFRAGYELNVPLSVAAVPSAKGDHAATESLLAINRDNIVIETCKQAEDDDAMIVRLYEAGGNRTQATLTTALPIRKAWEVNLLEETTRPLKPRKGTLRLTFKPFQIRTLKLKC